MLQQLFTDRSIYALGWAFVHSLWQGFIVALLLVLGLYLTRNSSAAIRYRLAYGSLVFFTFISFFTFLWMYQQFDISQIIKEQTLVNTVVKQDKWTSILLYFKQYFNENIPLIVILWLCGMLLFGLRLAGSIFYVERLKRYKVVALSNDWQETIKHLSARISLRNQVLAFESALINVPMTVGFMKPIILLPIGMINHLSIQQTEAVLAHELAHILRKDYLLNILQSVIEVIYYYHPVIWWISNIIRTEREHCCDDIAVDACGNSLVYVKTLVSLQELQRYQKPSLAAAFSGNRKQSLLFRVSRILNKSQNNTNVMEKFLASCSIFAIILAFTIGTHKGNSQTTLSDNKVDNVLTVGRDTIPDPDYYRSSTEMTIMKTENGKSVEMTIKNDNIESLVIDGKTIPASEYGQHQELVDKLSKELLNVPPSPPDAPEALDFPPPPPPPAPLCMPAPPPPPTPPTRKDKTTIFQNKGDDGTENITITNDSESALNISIKDGEVFVNNKKLDGNGINEILANLDINLEKKDWEDFGLEMEKYGEEMGKYGEKIGKEMGELAEKMSKNITIDIDTKSLDMSKAQIAKMEAEMEAMKSKINAKVDEKTQEKMKDIEAKMEDIQRKMEKVREKKIELKRQKARDI